jgi:hypothetical protein
MALSIAQKLKIKEGAKLLVLNAPDNFKRQLSPLPVAVKITDKTDSYEQIHWFVKAKAQMEKELPKILKLLKRDVICWIYYPKGTSKMQTDLTRDKGWDKLLAQKDLQWINLISFDDTWSAFGFRKQNETDKKKAEKPKAQREIFNWVDPVKKTVKLPAELETALKKDKKASSFFDTLSFTNKKEYIEWIVTAKREETKTERIEGTLERLKKEWKNPRNL